MMVKPEETSLSLEKDVVDLLTAAEMLGKTTRQIRYLVDTGRLAASKIKGRWVIRKEALASIKTLEAKPEFIEVSVDSNGLRPSSQEGRLKVETMVKVQRRDGASFEVPVHSLNSLTALLNTFLQG